MKAILGVAGAALLAFALTGCGTAATEPAAASITPTPKPTTYYGQTASAIAALVPGCSAIQAGDVGKGGPDMTSTASCVLGGRTVDFFSWQASASGPKSVITANKVEVYYAAGTGWTAHVRRDMTLFWQLTNDAGNLIRYAYTHPSPPAPDLPGEKATTEQIAATVGGSVEHVS